MTEEKQTPEWMAELKKWGIDVEAFEARWTEAGTDAKEQFQQALVKAQEEFAAGKSVVEEKVGEAMEGAEAFFGKMTTAWDEMVSNLVQKLRQETDDSDSSNTDS